MSSITLQVYVLLRLAIEIPHRSSASPTGAVSVTGNAARHGPLLCSQEGAGARNSSGRTRKAQSSFQKPRARTCSEFVWQLGAWHSFRTSSPPFGRAGGKFFGLFALPKERGILASWVSARHVSTL